MFLAFTVFVFSENILAYSRTRRHNRKQYNKLPLAFVLAGLEISQNKICGEECESCKF